MIDELVGQLVWGFISARDDVPLAEEAARKGHLSGIWLLPTEMRSAEDTATLVNRLQSEGSEAVSGYPNGENDMPRQGTIWYARLVPGDLLLPVRLKMATGIGTVDGYLAELHGRGKDLRLTD